MSIKLFAGWFGAVLVSTIYIRLLVVFFHSFIARLRLELFPPEATLAAGIAVATLWAFYAQNNKLFSTVVNREEVDEETSKYLANRDWIIRKMCGGNTLWRERDFSSEVGEVTIALILSILFGIGIAIATGFLLCVYYGVAPDPGECAYGPSGEDSWDYLITVSWSEFKRMCPRDVGAIRVICWSAYSGLFGGLVAIIYRLKYIESKIIRIRSLSPPEFLEESRAWQKEEEARIAYESRRRELDYLAERTASWTDYYQRERR